MIQFTEYINIALFFVLLIGIATIILLYKKQQQNKPQQEEDEINKDTLNKLETSLRESILSQMHKIQVDYLKQTGDIRIAIADNAKEQNNKISDVSSNLERYNKEQNNKISNLNIAITKTSEQHNNEIHNLSNKTASMHTLMQNVNKVYGASDNKITTLGKMGEIQLSQRLNKRGIKHKLQTSSISTNNKTNKYDITIDLSRDKFLICEVKTPTQQIEKKDTYTSKDMYDQLKKYIRDIINKNYHHDQRAYDLIVLYIATESAVLLASQDANFSNLIDEAERNNIIITYPLNVISVVEAIVKMNSSTNANRINTIINEVNRFISKVELFKQNNIAKLIKKIPSLKSLIDTITEIDNVSHQTLDTENLKSKLQHTEEIVSLENNKNKIEKEELKRIEDREIKIENRAEINKEFI